MDLRQYWIVFRRRAWVVVLLVAATGISYAIAPPPQTSGYVAGMRFAVGVLPEESDGSFYTYDRYYSWLTAEYLVDDLSEVVKSRAFASDVSALSGIAVPSGAIELEAIADAIVETLTVRAGTYLAQLSTEQAIVHAIDPPVVVPVQPSLRERLDLVLRLGLAIVIGVVAIFGLHALDRSLRTREEVEALGVPVLAQIPPTRSWWHRAIFRRADR